MHWFKKNWFRIAIVLLIAVFVFLYGYDRYQARKPKTIQEKIQRQLAN